MATHDGHHQIIKHEVSLDLKGGTAFVKALAALIVTPIAGYLARLEQQMATKDEELNAKIDAAIAAGQAEKAEVDEKLTAQAAELQAIRDEQAASGVKPETIARMDEVIATIQGIYNKPTPAPEA